MSMLRRVWSMIGALVLVGCSDEGDNKPPQAVADCNLFAETWCGHSMACLVEVGTLQQSGYQTNYDACVRVAEAAVPCANAIDTASAFDQCLLDIEAMPCSAWNVPVSQIGTVTPPTSCNGVVLVSSG